MFPSYLIFLDFDGVLHPVDASHDSQRFRPETIALVLANKDCLDAMGSLLLCQAPLQRLGHRKAEHRLSSLFCKPTQRQGTSK
jgi:hypothetical protein